MSNNNIPKVPNAQRSGVGNNFTNKPNNKRNNGPSTSSVRTQAQINGKRTNINAIAKQFSEVNLEANKKIGDFLTNNKKVKELLYNRTMNSKVNLHNIENYRERLTNLLHVLKKLSKEVGNASKVNSKILEKVKRNLKLENVKSFQNIEKKYNKLSNDQKKAYKALKRVGYDLRQLTVGKSEENMLRNFLNATLKREIHNKVIGQRQEGQTRGRGRVKYKLKENELQVLQKIINKYKDGNNKVNKVNNIINILYKHKKNIIENLHPFTKLLENALKKRDKSNENNVKTMAEPYIFNNKMKSKIPRMNKQIRQEVIQEPNIRISLSGDQIKEFFELICHDMIHDDTLPGDRKKNFNEIMNTLFINKNVNKYNVKTLNTHFNKYLDDVKYDIKKTEVNAESVKFLNDKIKQNPKKYRSVNANRVTGAPGKEGIPIRAARMLIRYLDPESTKCSVSKYKKFYVLPDIDKDGIVQHLLTRLRTHGNHYTCPPRGQFLLTPSMMLDPGGTYMNKEGLKIVPQVSNALKHKSVFMQSILKPSPTTVNVTIFYSHRGMTKNLGQTNIKIMMNDRRGYQVHVNNKIIPISSKGKAINSETILGKFLGDFLMIINTIMLQKKSNVPVAFATRDASAARIYMKMCEYAKDKHKDIKPRLFFTTANTTSIHMSIYGMEDVISTNQRGNKKVYNKPKNTNNTSNTSKWANVSSNNRSNNNND